jgi:hypothetical protein
VASCTPSIDALAEHVHSIAERRGIVVTVAKRSNIRAHAERAHNGEPPKIKIPPIRSLISYYTALHELGHLLGRGRSGNRLTREAAAWRWAIRNAKVKPNDAVLRSIGRALAGYYRWAFMRGEGLGCPKLPPPSSDFYTLLEECGFTVALGFVVDNRVRDTL